jgi:myo-inositol-1(or 4)-monophosphatase
MLNRIDIQSKVVVLVKEVGAYIRHERQHFSNDKIEIKGLNDLVSYVDKQAEQKLVNGLLEIFPEAGFIVEENSRSDKQHYNWIVDPLDGTTNFIHGVPSYAISVALAKEEEVLLGVVYEVSRDECFYAVKGHGSFCNGKHIHVSQNKTLKDSLVATGFPIYNFSRQASFLKSLDYFMQHTHGIRRIGAAAVDLCYVACGRMDAFYEFNLNAWDVAAGALLVQEAGGRVGDYKNGQNWLFGKEIVAANPLVYEEFQNVVQDCFYGAEKQTP